ncbi:arginyl-tRNA--protein transferase 1 isoform X2 [Morus notabilis]|uniref:arginyl-tRNA--protein transferase 1 isoform X2 n=1 Tax=Morus notabilis TaxID=981085 RepID=UPI000CED0A70|nr:arginyl-tRNA--protein transferase 1 isoform X2 [Morus notabilis]
MPRFLDGSLDSNKPVRLKEDSNASKGTCSSADLGVSSSSMKECLSSSNAEKNNAEKILQYLADKIDNLVHTFVESGQFPNDLQLPKASVKKVLQGKRKLFVEGSENLLYCSNIAFQIAAAIKKRAEPAMEDTHRSRVSKEVKDEWSSKAISEKLASSLNQLAETSGLSVRACNGHINFYSGTIKASLDGSAEVVTVTEGSAARRESKPCSLGNSYEHSPVKRRKLEIHLKRSSFDPEEYALYRRYQIKVHNDTPDHVTESSYKRFLVDTPLIFVPPTNDGTVPPCGFGSFHQQYVIDGQLVAVGVVDILPRCLSSKYLFWDPDFAFLSLGKYSALQEINWVKENQIHCPSLQFYYLGYYIHSCNKMRYKATYRPSELLCPLRYQWVSFDVTRPFLDRKAYVVLSDCALLQDGESSDPNASEQAMEVEHNDISFEGSNDVPMHQTNEDADPEYESSDDESGGESSDPESVQFEIGDINNILIGLKGTCLKYKDLQRAFRPSKRSYLETQLHRYLRVVGKEVGERMIYSLG